MVDPLTDALHSLRISTTLYAVAHLADPWGVSFPAGSGAYFHVVWGEACWLTVEASGELHRVGPGDVVLLPHAPAHRLTATPDGTVRTRFDPQTWTPRRLISAPAQQAASGGVRINPAADRPAAGRTELVCGAVRIRRPASHPVLGPLPAVVAIGAGTPGADQLHLTARILRAETAHGRPGVDAVLARLGDVLLVQILRIWAAQHPPAETGWLVALADPEIGAAITALHADPAAAWSVEALATVAGMSRSRFAERFTALVGQPPLTYLGNWRMTRAVALLSDPTATIRDVGRRVGFSSEPAFNRAFVRHHAMPPGRYRRLMLEERTGPDPDG